MPTVNKNANRVVRRALYARSTVIWALGLWSLDVVAQSNDRGLIPDEPSCTSCAIVVSPSVQLQVKSADPRHYPPKVVRQDGMGRYWALSGFEPPMLFDQSGRFLRRVGRTGSGPGEFERLQDIISLPGDSVLVIEVGRAQVLGPDLRATRRIILNRQLYPGVVLEWPSAVVLSGDVGGQYLGRRRAHLVDLSRGGAQMANQLEYDDAAPRVAFPSAGVFELAFSPSSRGVWSADPFIYRLVQWNRTRGITTILQRRPEWFATRSEFWNGNASTPPPPRIAAMHEDESGLLWVYVLVAAPDWETAWARTRRSSREVNPTDVDVLQLFQTTVEVIDPVQRRVVARTRRREFLVDVLPGNRAVFYDEDSRGEPRVMVNTLTLVRK